MMVAERGADLIKGQSLKLSKSAPTYTDKDWKLQADDRALQCAALRI
jgi:hypothetical protein